MTKFIDNSKEVKNQLERNIIKALTAIGEVGVELIVDYMRNRYDTPIHLTGDLQRDVDYKVNEQQKHTIVGNKELEYAPWIHNGTMRIRGRPYIKDAIDENKEMFREVAKEYLSDGF